MTPLKTKIHNRTKHRDHEIHTKVFFRDRLFRRIYHKFDVFKTQSTNMRYKILWRIQLFMRNTFLYKK